MLNGQEIKNLIKVGIKHATRPIIICVIGAFILVTLFWAVIDGIGDSVTEIFTDVVDNVEISGNNIEIDQDYLNNAKSTLDKRGINSTSLGLGSDDEYLERYLEAEIVTNFPYLGGDGLQGAVYFERMSYDGNTKQLKYIPYEQFYEKVDSNEDDISDYFTVDEEDWTVHVMKIDGNIEKINYKSMVEKFSMPFQFPVYLAMTTQNPQFALAVVNLVKESRIVITIAESKTTTTTTTTESYYRTTTRGSQVVSAGQVQGEPQVSVEETYSTEIFLSRAQTWILNEITDINRNDKEEDREPVVTGLSPSTVTSSYVNENNETITVTDSNRILTTNVHIKHEEWIKGTTEVTDNAKNFTNLILRDNDLINGQGIVGVAKELHDYLAENDYWYPSQANLNAGKYVQDGWPITHRFPTKGEAPSDRYVDCSAYVSWVLREVGYEDIGCLTVADIDAYGQKLGWDVISNLNDVQAGDICVWNGQGHINICVGKNESGDLIYYDCGCTDAIRAEDPIVYGDYGFVHALRPNDEIAQALTPETDTGLRNQINEYIDRIEDGKYSVRVLNLDRNSENVLINDAKIESNGFIKLFIMASAYDRVKSMDIKEEDVSADIERMITTDDNTAANNILKNLGEGDIKKGISIVETYCRFNGYNNTHLTGELDQNEHVGDEKAYTSLSDVSKLLQKIYEGNCINADFSKKMKEMLEMQIKNEMIPSTITEGKVANKTGEQSGIVQDAAIISTEKANYLIIVSAREIQNIDAAKNNIIEIAKIVNTYFSKNGNLLNNEINYDKQEETGGVYTRMNGRRVCYRLPEGGGYQCPLNNLIESREMLFQLLRKSTETQNHERLMRYILYLLTGDDYGVTEFDFNEFLNGSFNEVSGIYGNTIQEKVWWALIDAGYSKEAAAGVLGNIEQESSFDNTIVNSIGASGMCQWLYERKDGLLAYAKSKGVDWTDVNTQIEYLLGELQEGGGADGYATYNLIPTHGYTASDWKNAKTPEDAAVAFCWTFERPGDAEANISVRQANARKYYNQFKDAKKPDGATTTNSNGNDVQKKIAEIASKKDPFGTGQGWCQAWVEEVYVRATGQERTWVACATEAANKYVVSKDKSNIPLGACVYGHAYIAADGSQAQCGNGHEAGHVGIYVGNGQIASNVGGIQIESIDSWTATYGWKGWGWNGRNRLF